MDKETLLLKKFPKQDTVIRILCIICSVGMIILCVICFFDYQNSINSPIDVVLPIYYAYFSFSIFGILMGVSEFRC